VVGMNRIWWIQIFSVLVLFASILGPDRSFAAIHLQPVDQQSIEEASRLIGSRLGAGPLGEHRVYSGYLTPTSRIADCFVKVEFLGLQRRLQGISVEITDGAFIREAVYADFLLAPMGHRANLAIGVGNVEQSSLEVMTQMSPVRASARRHIRISRANGATRVEITELNRDNNPILQTVCSGLNIPRGVF
jgi:hypothetical protein